MFSWMNPVTVQYYKRYRMEFDLRRMVTTAPPQRDYRFWAWRTDLREVHADVKYRSFRGELDAQVFPCLGEAQGCQQLINEITDRETFLPEATWLAVYEGGDTGLPYYVGTIQGLSASAHLGSIQNVGTVPEHRGRGIGTELIVRALRGFQQFGHRHVSLEVTAQNTRAVHLYTRLGFRHVKTVYKAVEAAYT